MAAAATMICTMQLMSCRLQTMPDREPDDSTHRDVLTFALAWRDLRRARWLAAFGDALMGEGDSPLEAGDVDTLDQIAFGGSARMHEIANGLQVDASTATRAVDRLSARGLVDRGRDPEDGRFTRVALTDEGRQINAALREQRLVFVSSVLDRFDDDDRAQLIALLPKLAEAVTDELRSTRHEVRA